MKKFFGIVIFAVCLCSLFSSTILAGVIVDPDSCQKCDTEGNNCVPCPGVNGEPPDPAEKEWLEEKTREKNEQGFTVEITEKKNIEEKGEDPARWEIAFQVDKKESSDVFQGVLFFFEPGSKHERVEIFDLTVSILVFEITPESIEAEAFLQ